MRTRKWIAAAVVLVTTAAVAGCASGSGDADDDAASTGKLVWWSEFAEGEPMQVVFAEIADDFEEETGIEVDVQWKGVQPVKQLIPSLGAGGAPPIDLVDSYHGEIVRQLGSVGMAADLSDLMDETIPGEDLTLAEALGEANVRDSAGLTGPEPYMAPFIVTTYGFLYDKALHPEVAEKPPTDWDDFYGVLDGLKEEGRQPLAADGALTGANNYYFLSFVYAYSGWEKWNEALEDKTGETWRDPDILKAAEQVEKLAKGGYFLDGYEATQYPGMQQKWANNDSDFLLNHSGVPSESAPYLAETFEMGAFPFPGVDGKGPGTVPVDLNGFGILEGAANAENAEQFILFMMKKENQQKLADIGQVPARPDVEAPESVAGMREIIASGDTHQFQGTPEMIDLLQKVVYPNDDELFFGKITAKEFIDRLADQSAEFWSTQG
jgi:raffinose/stachyose/melibiose transport system substrate-binding protein